MQTEKKANWYHFDFRGGSRTCYSCGTYEKQVPCGARKLVQIGYWISEEAENAAYRITTQAYRKIKRDMAMEITEQHVETQSLEAVAELKKGSDT